MERRGSLGDRHGTDVPRDDEKREKNTLDDRDSESHYKSISKNIFTNSLFFRSVQNNKF